MHQCNHKHLIFAALVQRNVYSSKERLITKCTQFINSFTKFYASLPYAFASVSWIHSNVMCTVRTVHLFICMVSRQSLHRIMQPLFGNVSAAKCQAKRKFKVYRKQNQLLHCDRSSTLFYPQVKYIMFRMSQ